MSRNALKQYPHLILNVNDSRKAKDRRAAALAPKTTTLPEQRAMFDDAITAELAFGRPFPELLKGAYIGEPGGFWVYEYHHIQARWIGWLGALSANGITVKA